MVKYPSDWSCRRLVDCITLVPGLTYTPEKVKKYGTLVLRSSNIQNQRLALDDNVYVDMNVPPEKMIQEGDILVCVRNGSASLIGKSCILPWMEHTTFGAFMAVLRGDKTGFLSFLFESKMVQNQLKNRSSATINQITKKDFEDVKIVVPNSEAEQIDIAKTLRTFQKYEDDLRRLIEKKKGIRDGALEELMSGKKRLDGFSGKRRKAALGQLYTIIMGQSPSASSYNIQRDGIPLVQGMADMKHGVTCPQRYTSDPTKTCEEGAVILSVRAPVGNVGRTNQEVCLGRGVCAIVGVPQDFVFYLMKFHQETWKKLEQGSTFTAVGGKEVRNFEVEIPDDIREQEAIAQVLSSMDAEIAALEAEREKVCGIRAGAMEDLLTGRIRLKD